MMTETQTDPITIVSGLPRSGTSMMMRMLHAGGMEPVVDDMRQADVDNPGGYYELEKAKKIATDASWLPDARGKVFKMVSMLLPKLPATYEYRIVFMRRDMPEILASQARMLARLGKAAGPDDAQMAILFTQHLANVDSWLGRQSHMAVMQVAYRDVIDNPREVAGRLAAFLERPLDVAAMAGVVDPTLYRNRA